MKDVLFIIPARGGSKRLSGKNTKLFFGKPLIVYSLDYARNFVGDDQICVSTDSEEIINCVKKFGYNCQFTRPAELSGDTAKTDDVLRHAYEYYSKSYAINKIVLLQPTTPFRLKESLVEALKVFSESECDMVLSCKKIKSSPYTHLFEKEANQYLVKSKTAVGAIPDVYEVNGSIYVIDAKKLQERDLYQFDKIKMVEMSDHYSIDIDTIDDWDYAEYLVNSKKVKI